MSSRWRVPALAGAALLAGLATGGGTFAVWNTGRAVPQAVVTSGNLDIRAESTTWTETSGDVSAAPHTIDPEEFLVRAGDTVAVRYEFSTQLQGDNMLGQLAVDWDDGAPSLAEEVSGTYVVYQVVEGTDVPLTEPLPLGQSTTPGPTAAQIDTDDAGRIDTFAIVVDLEFEGMADRFGAGSEMQTADLGQLHVTLDQTRTGEGFDD